MWVKKLDYILYNKKNRRVFEMTIKDDFMHEMTLCTLLKNAFVVIPDSSYSDLFSYATLRPQLAGWLVVSYSSI